MTIRSILSKGGNKMEDRILLKELADKAQPEFKDKIVLARVNGKLCELWKKVYPDSKIEYITTPSILHHSVDSSSTLKSLFCGANSGISFVFSTVGN